MRKPTKCAKIFLWILLALLIAPIPSHAISPIPPIVPAPQPGGSPLLLPSMVQHSLKRAIALQQAEAQTADKRAASSGDIQLSAAHDPASADNETPERKDLETVHTESTIDPAYELYETTAYYLNVRKEPGSKAKILRVVEKGTRLLVKQATDNGWLQLHDSGYVYGYYAKRVQPQPDSANLPEARGDSTAEEPSKPVQAENRESPQPPSQPSFAVHLASGLTEAHIDMVLKGTALENESLAPAILEIEAEHGINALFTIAVMKLESGNGKSRLAKTKNNLFGLNATGGSNSKAYAFETKADSVRKFGQLIADHYVGKGYTTIEKIGGKYCPANDDWPKLVKQIMKSDHRKVVKSSKL